MYTAKDLRTDFPALDNSTYLNVVARGLISRTTKTAVNEVLDGYLYGDGVKEDWIAIGESARQRFAHLLNAKPTEIAFTKNVSDGLNAILTGMDWKPGDNLVYCPEFEHPNLVYACWNLKKYGVHLREVPARNGEVCTSAMIENMDLRTRMVAVSSVGFSTGFRTDLKTLGDACGKNGTFLLVDAAQSSGVLSTDVKACCIDGLATSTGKGLLGIYGQGLLYCSDLWQDRLTPAYLSRFGVDAAGLHESEMGPPDYALYASARRFEVGNANWPGIAAVAKSMEQLDRIGALTIEQHALALSSRLAQGLKSLGYPVQLPSDPRASSHIVTVGTLSARGTNVIEDQRLTLFAKALRQANVVFSIRRGVMRFATHIYNAPPDIDLVLEIARGIDGN